MAPITRKVTVSTPIACPADTIFQLIIDLPGYNSWLPQSPAFKGTTEVSDTPIKVGSTYVERSPSGTRYGEVVLLDERERHVLFHQPMRLALGLQFDVQVDMKVEDRDESNGSEPARLKSSIVNREVTLRFPVYMYPVVGYIYKNFETEILRTMKEMKKHLERKPDQVTD
ncbi:hypothetical protein FMUND_13247 [Fusarium mundagurra]|uniref:Polyketide cyclase n=1 Tax=Fusarium mundagurra TaxID=1567541 RepID=A0A8H5XZ36_9HYPO|nr:hypothetical protein FMUND_13247 [Fusarium mundagurra]